MEALTFMFMSILIHKVAYSAVMWYRLGPELGGIKKEGGKNVEEQLVGLSSRCQVHQKKSMILGALQRMGLSTL